MDIDYELDAITREYTAYFPECLFVSQSEAASEFSHEDNTRLLSHIRMTTREGSELKISVSGAGWFLVGQNSYFPTFEALMNTESPEFSRTFANSLTNKLNALAELQ